MASRGPEHRKIFSDNTNHFFPSATAALFTLKALNLASPFLSDDSCKSPLRTDLLVVFPIAVTKYLTKAIERETSLLGDAIHHGGEGMVEGTQGSRSHHIRCQRAEGDECSCSTYFGLFS